MSSVNSARRPLKSRQNSLMQKLAATLASLGVTPNAISGMSVVFAAGSCAAAFTNHPVLAAAGIQLRLLCNLMDGMVAVEHGKKTKTGDLWNDVPDRFADVMIIAGAGFIAITHPFARDLAWANASLAVITAYLRVLGASLKSPHYFNGPMAKPHRMAILTFAFIVEAIFPNGLAVYTALWIMFAGQLVTCWNRLRLVTRDLESK